MFRHAIEQFDEDTICAERIIDFYRSDGKQFNIEPPSFWDWDEAENLNPFRP